MVDEEIDSNDSATGDELLNEFDDDTWSCVMLFLLLATDKGDMGDGTDPDPDLDTGDWIKEIQWRNKFPVVDVVGWGDKFEINAFKIVRLSGGGVEKYDINGFSFNVWDGVLGEDMGGVVKDGIKVVESFPFRGLNPKNSANCLPNFGIIFFVGVEEVAVAVEGDEGFLVTENFTGLLLFMFPCFWRLDSKEGFSPDILFFSSDDLMEISTPESAIV